MDVCAGGSISVGATSITFTNHHTVACKITSCELPGFPPIPPDVVVPAKVGSQPGTKTVPLNPPPTVKGDYEYTPDCCNKETNPVARKDLLLVYEALDEPEKAKAVRAELAAPAK